MASPKNAGKIKKKTYTKPQAAKSQQILSKLSQSCLDLVKPNTLLVNKFHISYAIASAGRILAQGTRYINHPWATSSPYYILNKAKAISAEVLE